jgi:hypothetical protein
VPNGKLTSFPMAVKRKGADSPVEQRGFESSVPRKMHDPFGHCSFRLCGTCPNRARPIASCRCSMPMLGRYREGPKPQL